MGNLVCGLGFQIGHTRREENERLPNLISESFGSSNLSRSIESQISCAALKGGKWLVGWIHKPSGAMLSACRKVSMLTAFFSLCCVMSWRILEPSAMLIMQCYSAMLYACKKVSMLTAMAEGGGGWCVSVWFFIV